MLENLFIGVEYLVLLLKNRRLPQLGGDYLWMVEIKSKSEMPILGEAKSDILHFDTLLTRPK